MKLSKLTISLLTSTAVFAGVVIAQGKTVSADSTVKVNYSSNLRQQPGTDAKIIGGLSVGETHTYTKTAKASGYTWYQIGQNQWVADAGAAAATGQVKVDYASNKRVGPSLSHKIVGGYYPGQVLSFTATTKANGYTWYKVGANAWVASAGVSDITGTASTSAAATTTAAATTATSAATTPATSAATTSTAKAPVASTPATTTTTPAASTATATTAAPAASAPSTQAAATTKTTPAATTPASSAATTTAPTVTAASGRVKTNVVSNLRSNAGTGYSVVGSLPAGSVRAYSATAQANGYTWYKVAANAWVAGATPYYGTTNTTATQNTTPATSAASTSTPATTTTTTTTSGSKTASNNAGNAYAWGQCTWYVKSVAPWAGNYWGNGGQWGASAAAEGFTVNHTPAVGSIVVVAGGQNFGGWTAAAGYGHVAYVVGVSGNTITVQQGGQGFSNPGGPNTQVVSGASNFTYIHR